MEVVLPLGNFLRPKAHKEGSLQFASLVYNEP